MLHFASKTECIINEAVDGQVSLCNVKIQDINVKGPADIDKLSCDAAHDNECEKTD